MNKHVFWHFGLLWIWSSDGFIHIRSHLSAFRLFKECEGLKNGARLSLRLSDKHTHRISCLLPGNLRDVVCLSRLAVYIPLCLNREYTIKSKHTQKHKTLCAAVWTSVHVVHLWTGAGDDSCRLQWQLRCSSQGVPRPDGKHLDCTCRLCSWTHEQIAAGSSQSAADRFLHFFRLSETVELSSRSLCRPMPLQLLSPPVRSHSTSLEPDDYLGSACQSCPPTPPSYLVTAMFWPLGWSLKEWHRCKHLGHHVLTNDLSWSGRGSWLLRFCNHCSQNLQLEPVWTGGIDQELPGSWRCHHQADRNSVYWLAIKMLLLERCHDHFILMMSFWCHSDDNVVSWFLGWRVGAVRRSRLFQLSMFSSQRSEGKIPHAHTAANQSPAASWHHHSCTHFPLLTDLWHLQCPLINQSNPVNTHTHTHTHSNNELLDGGVTEESIGAKLAAVYLKLTQQIPHTHKQTVSLLSLPKILHQ